MFRNDIGNLYFTLDKIVKQKESGKPRTIFHGTSIKIDQASARKKLLELLRVSDLDFIPKSRKVAEIQHEEYTQEELMINLCGIEEVPATVLVPKNGKKRHPAIIALHDHSGFYLYGRKKIIEEAGEDCLLKPFREKMYDGIAYANELAKAGFLVLTIDAFYFGDRKLDTSLLSDTALMELGIQNLTPDLFPSQTYNRICDRYESIVCKHIMMSGETWPGILCKDDLQSFKYLQNRSDVDPEKIGCIGMSLGGFRAALLTACEPRIRVCVQSGWMTTLHSLLLDHCMYHTFMVQIPGLASIMDFPDIIAIAAPCPVLTQVCRTDSLYTQQGMKDACKHIKKIYDFLGQEDMYQYVFYNNGHKLTLEMQKDALEWLKKHLTIREE